MIKKNISEILYADIKFLLENKIDESDVLDYKREMIKDQDLVKHVCAFANTRGGHIIFGVKESGKGGYPIEIKGLDKSDLNKERLEQILLSHIVPRLDVKIKSIEIPDSGNSILLIQIPESYQKPHQSNLSKKFYKRFQFESIEMTESEVADRYRSRFSNYKQINQYIEEMLTETKENTITTNVLVVPSNIENRLIDASNYEQIEKLQSIRVSSYFGNTGLPNNSLQPFAHGLTSKSPFDTISEELQIHRNGCVQYIYYYKMKEDDTIFLSYEHLAKKLMEILQFSNIILSNYNYFGDVKIIVTLTSSSKNAIPDREGNLYGIQPLDNLNSLIEREHSMDYIENKYEQIASSIMNEIFNHYHGFRCPLFDEQGNYNGYGSRKRKQESSTI